MSEENNGGLPPEIFQKLLDKYRSTIPERLQAIHDAIEALKSEPTKENLAALRFLVHKMAGNAGTFGYENVTKLCRTWEIRVAEMVETFPNCQIDAPLFQELALFYITLRKEFGIHGR